MSDDWTVLVTRVLAPNPSPMTLEGTNSYVVRHPASPQVVVVDPGPLQPLHLKKLASFGAVELILLTDHHTDHSGGAERLAEITGAPIRAADVQLCLNAPALQDGEEIKAAGTRISVLATPGHTADSVCVHLPDDCELGEPARSGSMLTGDTILGRGTAVIADPDGSVHHYLTSLMRLRSFSSTLVLPGHGPYRTDLVAMAEDYLEHRHARRSAVRAMRDDIASSGRMVTAGEITDRVYRHADPNVRAAAEASVRAQLRYIEEFT